MTLGREGPRVSVAVITYNQREFVRECLESCLAQDVPDVEIVVADDGSTDETPAILKELARLHPDRIVLTLADRNQGITANSNRALGACRGEYIAWMGGDDVMLAGKLRQQLAYMDAHPDCAISYHDLEVFDSHTGKTLRHFNSGPGSHRPLTGGADVVVEHGAFQGACSVMTRRSACPPGGFDPRIPIASDWLFWIETAVNGRLGFLPAVLGRYRRHPGSVTAQPRDRSEQHLTLAIVESRYPRLAGAARRHRSRLFYMRAVEHILAGKPALARPLLLESLRSGWVSWKWLGWLLRTWTG